MSIISWSVLKPSIRFSLIGIVVFWLQITISQTLSVSLRPIPVMVVGQTYSFEISHDQRPEEVSFSKLQGPQFIDLSPQGIATIYPDRQGLFDFSFRCFLRQKPNQYVIREYLIQVKPTFDNQDSLSEPRSLWILDSDNFYKRINERSLSIETNLQSMLDSPSVQFLENEFIEIQLSVRNTIGNKDQTKYYFKGLPQGLAGESQKGTISGSVGISGFYMCQVSAVDSINRVGSLHLMIHIRKPYFVSYLHTDYSQAADSDSKDSQNQAVFLERELTGLLDQRSSLVRQRASIVTDYREKQIQKDRYWLAQKQINQNIESISRKITAKLYDLSSLEKNLTAQEKKLGQLESVFRQMELDYNTKLEENQNLEIEFKNQQQHRREISSTLHNLAHDIGALEDHIFRSDVSLQERQHELSRMSVELGRLQREEIRQGEILKILKNIQFEYLIKKVQIDAKVRSKTDNVFISQSNFDDSQVEYRKVVRRIEELQAEYLKLELQIKERAQMKQFITDQIRARQIKLELSKGQLESAKIAKSEQDKLLLEPQAKGLKELQKLSVLTAKDSPEISSFAGCEPIGNFNWIGAGAIKTVKNHGIQLETGEQIRYGPCTEIDENLSNFESGDLIQFSGYYWNGAIQAVSISIINFNGQS